MLRAVLGRNCRTGLACPKTRYKKIQLLKKEFGRYLKATKPPSSSERDVITLSSEYRHLRWLMPHIKHRSSTSTNYPSSSASSTRELATPNPSSTLNAPLEASKEPELQQSTSSEHQAIHIYGTFCKRSTQYNQSNFSFI